MKLTANTTKWIKYSTIHHCEVMGKDHLVFGDGCFLIFWNLTNGNQKYYKANNKASGDGVRYAVAHRNYYMFAFAEKCTNPRIILMTYPDFTRINVLPDGHKFGYQKLAFSETDYLVSLCNFPHYNIIVWNWRTGEKINSVKSNILTDQQTIRVMVTNSVLSIAQMSTNDLNQISVWELMVCCKKSVLKETKVEHTVKNDLCGNVWTTEGSLFVLDIQANVYLVNGKQSLELVIPSKQESRYLPFLVWYKGGLLLFGTDNKLRHYKKSGQWILEREIECPEPLKRLITAPKDLICISLMDNVYTCNLNEGTFNAFIAHEGGINEMCMIYPMGTRIVTLAHNHELALWETESGKLVDLMPLQEKALCLKENPEYPYIGISFENGVLSLVSVYDLNKLTFLTSFHLTKNPLNSIYFTEIGKLIVTADLFHGQFFVIEGYPGSKMQVIATVTANKQIADYILVASKTCLRLFGIAVTSRCYIAGNKFIRYCIIKGQRPEYKEYKLEESTVLYSKLHATKLANRDRVFYATPLTTKCIHQIETKRADDYARVIATIGTPHQMKKILYHVDNYHTISYAYDGLIFVYADFLKTERYTLIPHHRLHGGVKKAYVDPTGMYVISIDRRNILVCSSIDGLKVNQQLIDELKQLHFSSTNETLFKHPTIGFVPKGELAGKTWLEVQEINLREHERKLCEEKRNDILEKFQIIKSSIQNLLTANIEGPENERLDIQKFNIDLALKQQKLLKSREDCDRMRAYLLALIVAQDKVTKFIKAFCLERMDVAGQCIYAFYENYNVTNYTLISDKTFKPFQFELLLNFREIETFLSAIDMFKPWVPLIKSELIEKLEKPPCLKPDTTPDELLHIDEEDEELEEDIDEETKQKLLEDKKDKISQTLNAFEGNIGHNYVEPEPLTYDQYEVITFAQTELQHFLGHAENHKTKTFFNKHFNSLRSIKERELYNIKEYNQRLRHIISEINYFSKNKLSVFIDDPEVHQEEYPERILQVEDNEISITPYVSPSEQARLDAEAAEAERLRLLLLADDFRERALMAMMNGVLEIRWEDELRKEVPKPKCMLEKNPEDFNEEDLRLVRQYEIDVAFLLSERERYKVLLEAEYGKVAQSVREAIKKFNSRLDELFLLKLKIDSSINLHTFRLYRKRLLYYKEIVMQREENFYESEIARVENETERLQKLIGVFYENLNETRGHYDTLMAKEKTLEKNLKKDFSETSPMVQDQAQKLYKKRPKVTIRSTLTSTVYLELARAIVSHERPKILSNECIEFVKAVDNLDMYVGISSTVDENNYALLCKHRRLRIDNELRMKALFADITEGENTIAVFQKTITELKEKQMELTNSLAQLRSDKLLNFKDMEIQMVIRGGYVEVPLTGCMDDFKDAILVPRQEVEEINNIITKAGKKKIKAMEDVMKFKRGILSKEWEHKRLKMRISDLKDTFEYINSIKVTKEIQAYLKAKSRGEKEEKITFEQEIEIVKKSYERIIDEMKAKVIEIIQKINQIKKENKILDRKISDVNVDVCEYKLEFDYDMDEHEKNMLKFRTSTLLKRAKLVREIQSNHNEILVLQTELEILRLKTFPTLKYKIFT